jgi:hypothetical protein
MLLRDQIFQILKDPKYKNPDCEDNRADDLFALVSEENWTEVCYILLEILQREDMQLGWDAVATALYYAVGKHYPVPADRLIALLYHCLMETKEFELGLHDENLVWTITRVLKGVKYDSNYDPFQDPAVWQEMLLLKPKK